MSDIRELYQELILDHGRYPRNHRVMSPVDYQQEGYNPLCGDKITIYIKMTDTGVIADLSFQGCGCAISMASASLMTELLNGKSMAEAKTLFEQFQKRVTGESASSNAAVAALGKLNVLAGVSAYPARVKCATLAWHTVNAALSGSADAAPISTEEDATATAEASSAAKVTTAAGVATVAKATIAVEVTPADTTTTAEATTSAEATAPTGSLESSPQTKTHTKPRE